VGKLKNVNKIDPPVSITARLIAEKVIEIWKKASIPVLSIRRVIQMITTFHKQCRDLLKSTKRDPSQQLKEEIFVGNAKKTLFDICTCKCENPATCPCEKSRKVPEQEIPFLVDQRTNRKMVIGSIDVATTTRLQKRQLQEKDANAGKQRSGSGPRKRLKKGEDLSSGEATNTSTDAGTGTDSDFENQPSTSSQNTLSLERVASAAYRTGVSRRKVVMLVSAAFEDASVISSSNLQNVTDKSEISREMKKLEKKMNEDRSKEVVKARGLYFDGKKERTIAKERKGERFYRKDVVEHVCLVQELGTSFLGHVSPKSGTAGDIEACIVHRLSFQNMTHRNWMFWGATVPMLIPGTKKV